MAVKVEMDIMNCSHFNYLLSGLLHPKGFAMAED